MWWASAVTRNIYPDQELLLLMKTHSETPFLVISVSCGFKPRL